MSVPATFLDDLRAATTGAVLTDENDLLERGRDRTRFVLPAPRAAVIPRTADEVAAIVRVCGAHDVGVVPSGGRTGLAGGAVAPAGELVLALDKLDDIGAVDEVGQTISVGAGVILEHLHEHLKPHGLFWPVDLGARGSCQVGGNISTCAGGIRFIRYGSLRSWVLGLDVVLASGERLTLGNAVEKDNTGLDLKQLFIGAEGTLGVVVGATLKLTSLPGPSDTWLLGAEDTAAASAILASLRRAGCRPLAFEIFTDACLAVVEAEGLGALPLSSRSPMYVVFEVERNPDGGRAEAAVAELMEAGIVTDGTRGQSDKEHRALFGLREHISEALGRRGPVWKDDIAVAVRDVPALAAGVTDAADRLRTAHGEEAAVFLYGHLGDGNLHVNFPRPSTWDDDRFAVARGFLHQEIGLVLRTLGGSVSAEHGVGLLKRADLALQKDEAELALMQSVKDVLDPAGLMNPGKVFPDRTV